MPQAQQGLVVMVRKSAGMAIRPRTNADFLKTLNGCSEIVWMVADQLVNRRAVEHITTGVVLLGWIKCRL